MSSAQVKVRNTDTQADYLRNKFTSGDGSITFAIANPGANEIIDIRAVGGGGGTFTALLNPEQFANGEVIGDGSTVTLTSLGYSQPAANALWPLTAAHFGGNVPLSATIDTVAIIEANLSMEDQAYQSWLNFGMFSGKEYVTNFSIPLPKTSSKISEIWGWEMYGCTIRSISADPIVESMPASQTEADTIISRGFSFSNGTFYGPDNAGDGSIAFLIGATVYLNYTNCHISRCDYGWDLQFCLFAQFIECAGIGCAVNNWFLHSGTWTGASLSNSQCNDTDFFNCRTFNALQSDYGIRLEDSSDINLIGCTSEGGESGTRANQPKAGIYFNDNNSTVVKGFNIDGLHAEQSYTRAVIEIHGREGIYNVKDLYNQIQGIYSGVNDNYIWLETNAGENHLNFTNNLYATPFMRLYNASHYGHWYFYTCVLNDDPTNVYELQAATLWNNTTPDISELTIIPLRQVDYIQNTAPGNGATINVITRKTQLLVNPAGTLATLTINLVPGTYDGQPLDIIFTQIVTTLTFTGTSLITALGNPILGTHFRLKWCAPINKWG